ncbi:MAG TPA: hypothetical protein VFZ00_11865 [Solirubrobacter sp.]|nr:hypothetical protein [Solirubrobacter sp.]
MSRRLLLAAALLCAVFADPARAAEYEWVAAGNISQARSGVASAVLHDGRVLIAGGITPPAELEDVTTVDIYDPRTNTWSAAPPMGEPRSYAAAATLRDGRVLVLGGSNQADEKRAELFDPVVGRWTRVADANGTNGTARAFVLGDGRALFLTSAGGEIYDPATNSWRKTAEPHGFNGIGPVVRLRDGRFLVVNQKSVSDGTTWTYAPAAEIYDLASDTWSVVAPPRYGHEGAIAALLPDGRVLVAGGHPGFGPDGMFHATAHANAEIFDPVTGTWSPTGALNRPRAAGSVHGVMPGGEVAAGLGSWATIVGPAGQRRIDGIFHEFTAELYEPAAGAWRVLPEAVYARSGGTSVMLADGSMLVAGGVANGGFPLTAAERLVPRPVAPVAAQPEGGAITAPPEPERGTLRVLKPSKRLKPSRTGTLTLRVRCAKGGASCSDQLVLRGRGRLLAQRFVSVRAGKTLKVRVKLRTAGRRALRGRTTRVTVTLRRQRTTMRVTVRG